MMPKKVSGIEGSDIDDANEVTDVANEEVGNDEEVNSEENENKDDMVKRLIMKTKMMVKRLIMKTKMMVKRLVKRVQCLQVY